MRTKTAGLKRHPGQGVLQGTDFHLDSEAPNNDNLNQSFEAISSPLHFSREATERPRRRVQVTIMDDNSHRGPAAKSHVPDGLDEAHQKVKEISQSLRGGGRIEA